MRVYLFLIVVLISCSSCATTSSGIVVGSQVWYDGRMQEIDLAYSQEKLTKEQQLNLKNEIDKIRLAYQTNENHINRQMLRSTSLYARPLYDCNNGVCNVVSP